MDRSKFTYHRLEKPTVKQISYASAISEYLGVDLPIEPTKAAYSRWIDKYSKGEGERSHDKTAVRW